MQPRAITLEQITNFVALTKYIKKIPIKICVGSQGEDSESFAHEMREMFNAAEFKTDASAGVWGITRDGSILYSKGVFSTNNSAQAIIIFNDPQQTNTTIVVAPIGSPIAFADDNQKIFDAISFCFGKISIVTKWIQKPDWVSPGEFEIYIPPKNN